MSSLTRPGAMWKLAAAAAVLCALAAAGGPNHRDVERGEVGARPPPPPDMRREGVEPQDFAFGPALRSDPVDPDRPVKPWGPAPYDRGGLIREYGARVKKLAHLEIRGTCLSACTMYLSVPGVCVDKYALLWFHAAFDTETGRTSPAGNAELRAHWPKPVREWAARVGALESVSFTRRRALSGVELIAMGVPACGPRPLQHLGSSNSR